MKKLFFALAMLLGVTACENSEQEPTLQQLIENFEMTETANQEFMQALTSHLLVPDGRYDENLQISQLVGLSPTTHYCNADGSSITFMNYMLGWRISNLRDEGNWSYNPENGELAIGTSEYTVAYYQHPTLMLRKVANAAKKYIYYEKYILQDLSTLESLLKEYPKRLYQPELAETLAGQVVAFDLHYALPYYPAPCDNVVYLEDWKEADQQFIYFEADGTGIAFCSEATTDPQKPIRYQKPITWSSSALGAWAGTITIDKTEFHVHNLFEKYISAQEQILGIEVCPFEQHRNEWISWYMIGYLEGTNVEELKKSYTDPQP